MSTHNAGSFVAWGCSKLLEFYLQHNPGHGFDTVIDSFVAESSFNGLPVVRPDADVCKNKVVVIFAMSSNATQAILKELHGYGKVLGEDVLLYSDFCWNEFSEKIKRLTDSPALASNHAIAKSYYLNSKLNVATSVLGNVLFMELLRNSQGSVAEVGVFNGANVVLGARQMVMTGAERPFHAFDTFEGFPELSAHDPSARKVGDMKGDASFETIRDNLSVFPFVRIHKGKVPDTFAGLPEEKYGLVFYDCDLYRPALDTFEYFWKRMLPGGYLFVHDYFAEEGGYVGVQKAVKEFFTTEPVVELWETTGCVIKKPA